MSLPNNRMFTKKQEGEMESWDVYEQALQVLGNRKGDVRVDIFYSNGGAYGRANDLRDAFAVAIMQGDTCRLPESVKITHYYHDTDEVAEEKVFVVYEGVKKGE